jgi:hypothetical protein
MDEAVQQVNGSTGPSRRQPPMRDAAQYPDASSTSIPAMAKLLQLALQGKSVNQPRLTRDRMRFGRKRDSVYIGGWARLLTKSPFSEMFSV